MTTEINSPESTLLLTITEKAAEKAKAMLAEREVTDGALRVFVAGGGSKAGPAHRRCQQHSNRDKRIRPRNLQPPASRER